MTRASADSLDCETCGHRTVTKGRKIINILLVEADAAQAAIAERVLHSCGHDITKVARGKSAVRFLKHNAVDLIIFDWQVPGMSGFDVLHWIRAHLGAEPPVLFLTSGISEVEIVHALEAGADDYVIKPFHTAGLAARVNALLLRTQRNSKPVQSIKIGAYVLDPAQRNISFQGRVVKLTTKEFDLIAYLFDNVGRIVSRALLEKLAWGKALDCSSRTIDTHIYRLRRKLLLRPENGARLTTFYAHGYRLDDIGQPLAAVAPMTPDHANKGATQSLMPAA